MKIYFDKKFHEFLLNEDILTRVDDEDAFLIDIERLQNFFNPNKTFMLYNTVSTQDNIQDRKSCYYIRGEQLILRFNIKEDEILIQTAKRIKKFFGYRFEPIVEQRMFTDISIFLSKEDKPRDDNKIWTYFNVISGKPAELDKEGYVVLGL